MSSRSRARECECVEPASMSRTRHNPTLFVKR
jgi:hypothetical protein